jgi:hypothetical protein
VHVPHAMQVDLSLRLPMQPVKKRYVLKLDMGVKF